MFGRGIFLILAIVVAFATPYFLSERPLDPQTGLRETRWWDALWASDANAQPYPTASVSPLPWAGTAFDTSRQSPTSSTLSNDPRELHDRKFATATRSMSDQVLPPSYPPSGGDAPPLDSSAPATFDATAYSPSSSSQPPYPSPRPYYPPGAGPPHDAPELAGSGPPDAEGWVTVRTWQVPNGQADGNFASQLPPANSPPPPVSPAPEPAAPATVPLPTLDQLFDFNIQPEWITYHWPRVSADLLSGDLAGMRVPLVSGTNPHDLAGSLSYYFDRQRTLQRIDFLGSTGDPGYLIGAVEAQYQLQPVPTLGGGLFLTGDADNVDTITSALRLRQAPVIRESEPLRRYLVRLELNRPGSDRRLSPEFATILRDDVRAKRWVPGQQPANSADPSARQLTQAAAGRYPNTAGLPPIPPAGQRFVYTPGKSAAAPPLPPNTSPAAAMASRPQPSSAPPPATSPIDWRSASPRTFPNAAPRQPG